MRLTDGCRGWQAQDVLSRLLEHRAAEAADGQQAREGGAETRGRGLSDDEIAAVLGDIMTAGGGSTGDAIATTLWRLACDSSMLARVRAEVDPVLGGSVSMEAGGGDGVPAALFEKVSAKDGGFVFTSALVKEVLRGSAFASVIFRLANQDALLGVGRPDMVQGEGGPGGRVGSAASPAVLIPQGAAVVMSPTVLGQDPDSWARPAAFDPQRFLASVADASPSAAQPQPAAAAFGSDVRSAVSTGKDEGVAPFFGTLVGRAERPAGQEGARPRPGVGAAGLPGQQQPQPQGAGTAPASTATVRRQLGKQPADPFAYIPFGAGPRICLGAQLAMVECVLAVAIIVARYDLAPVDAATEFPGSAPGLAPDPRLLVRVRPRAWPA